LLPRYKTPPSTVHRPASVRALPVIVVAAIEAAIDRTLAAAAAEDVFGRGGGSRGRGGRSSGGGFRSQRRPRSSSVQIRFPARWRISRGGDRGPDRWWWIAAGRGGLFATRWFTIIVAPRRDLDNRGDAPRTSAPSAPIDSTEEPFVLPGESLAKYRGGVPGTNLLRRLPL